MHFLLFPRQINCKTPDIRDCQTRLVASALSSYGFLSFRLLAFKGLLAPFPQNTSMKHKKFWRFQFLLPREIHQVQPRGSPCQLLQDPALQDCPLCSRAVPRSKVFSLISFLVPRAQGTPVPTATVCEARDVIFSTFKFLSSLLVPLVFTNLEIGA